ncbi:MAG: chemotaxis protein CheX [Candidatus Omnitrophica bacterium]|nr:chemotaxis protein CheX [Candidatus Omnitrophota bacterium]
MKVEYVNPFIESAVAVLQEIAGLKSERRKLQLKDPDSPFRDVDAILGVIGRVHGQVIYGFDEPTAKNVVSRMMMGAEILEFDEMARSALGELGNIITGKASIALESAGYPIEISPPTLVMAENVRISSLKIPMIVVPLETECGLIDIYVGLEETPD